MVEIRSYQPDFIDKQVEIGSMVIGRWSSGAQTGKEQLLKNYSQEGFDPETRLYAFKGEEMVGFLPASIQAQEEDKPLTARMELPLTLDGHEDVREPLLDKALDVLRSKGVAVVRTRAGSAWGYTGEFAHEKGFEHSNTIIKIGNYDLGSLPNRDYGFEIREFNVDTDIDMIATMFKDFYSISDEQVAGVIEQIKTGSSGVNFISHKIIIVDGKIVGRLTAYTQPNIDEVLMGTLVAFDGENKEQIQQDIIHAIFADVKSQGNNSISVTLSGPNIDSEDNFKDYNIDFHDSLSFFELKL